MVRFGARDYDPETGRWTTKEPLGFDGGLNFYTYGDNDPVNVVDMNGLWAQVVVSGNNVQITIPTSFTGPGATPAAVQSFKNAVQNTWSGTFGKYNVTTTVGSACGCAKGKQNKVYMPNKKYANWNPSVDAAHWSYAQWPPDSPPWTAAHEAGHLMGLIDRYVKGVGPNPGFAGDIMGDWGGVPREQDVTDVINANPNTSCQ